MALKKKNFSENEIAIFEDACIYKRGEYWHFRMWLAKEKRYVRRSLKTTSRATAVELAKDTYLDFYANLRQGKTFYKLTVGQMCVNENEALFVLHLFFLPLSFCSLH